MNLSLKSANKQGILRSTKISRRWLRAHEPIIHTIFLRTFESKRYLLNFQLYIFLEIVTEYRKEKRDAMKSIG